MRWRKKKLRPCYAGWLRVRAMSSGSWVDKNERRKLRPRLLEVKISNASGNANNLSGNPHSFRGARCDRLLESFDG